MSALTDLSNSLADAVERAGRFIVAVPEGGQRGVSGIVWRPGVVVTTEHTIRGANQVKVVLPDGRLVEGSVAGRDPSTDIAALKLDSGASEAEFAAADKARVGNIVLALGRRGSEGLAASYGIISAAGGSWRTWHGGRIDRWWRLDLEPYPGFSGGPLVDGDGRVLGINTSGPRRSIMTIPASTVDRVLTQLLEKGRIVRGYVGAALQPVRLPGGQSGLLIMTVAEGGPAAKAGLLIGDVLLSADGQVLSEPRDLHGALDPESVGKPLRMQVLRGGKPLEVSVTVGERPPRQ